MGVIAALSLLGTTAMQVYVLGNVLSLFFAIPFTSAVIVACITIVSYAYYSGSAGGSLTDGFQCIVLLLGFPLLAFLSIQAVGGWSQFIA